jgi:hypothetical protein
VTLTYEVTADLTIPPDQFNADGLAVLTAHGARYGGTWAINILNNDRHPLGEIRTEPDERPDMAVDTAHMWVNDVCARNNLKVVQAENLNGQLPADQRPFFALARFVVAAHDWQ